MGALRIQNFLLFHAYHFLLISGNSYILKTGEAGSWLGPSTSLIDLQLDHLGLTSHHLFHESCKISWCNLGHEHYIEIVYRNDGSQGFRRFISVYFLFRSERLSPEIKLTLHKALIISVKTYASPPGNLLQIPTFWNCNHCNMNYMSYGMICCAKTRLTKALHNCTYIYTIVTCRTVNSRYPEGTGLLTDNCV
jgi:hypothetical protein